VNRLWLAIAVTALVSALTKASGPLVLGDKPLPARGERLVSFLAPALLAALVVTDTIGSKGHLHLDARLVGLGAAALALKLRRSLLVTVIVAVAATAAIRHL
jgi:branched-subunit amino acid transport protein